MPDDQFATRVPASGIATIQFSPTKSLPWKLEQVSIEHRNAPSGCIAALRKNGNLITVLVASDVADSDPPIPVVPGDRVTVEWTGATPNAVVSVYIIYREVKWEDL